MLKLWKVKKVLVMSNSLMNWLRSRQFNTALTQGNERQAKLLLQKIESSGAKLSKLEQIFKKKIQFEQSLSMNKEELVSVSKSLKLALQKIKNLEDNKQILLTPNPDFIQFIRESLIYTERDQHKLQCTGIENNVFDDFEASLANFLQSELAKIPQNLQLSELDIAIKDLEGLKHGVDPKYSFRLSPHVYFMKYFLDNVYCTYIVWFLIYKSGLIPKNLKILDLAAGPGTVAYGLALLLQSANYFFSSSSMHISYYSLEKQSLLQYRGLQFWRQYIEPKQTATNAYFRFDTADIFDEKTISEKLPKSFFNFIVISHCFFYEFQQRIESHNIYNRFFQNNLELGGYVLLIVQGKKLFDAYNVRQGEDINQEQRLIEMFLEELGLRLEWYKYLTSTGERTPITSFGRFARENLPTQKYMSFLKQQYLGQKYISNYVLDDYVVLAKR